jgi:glycosyltransferase involved in cell wall biosynthesis
MEKLKKMAKPNIRFVGRVSEAEKYRLYQECKAFVFPGEEDFGITPVEAQSFGKPVIAFGQGGALETVIDGVTGVHYHERTVDALINAVIRGEEINFDPDIIRKNAMKFDWEVFKKQLMKLVQEKYEAFMGQSCPSTFIV